MPYDWLTGLVCGFIFWVSGFISVGGWLPE